MTSAWITGRPERSSRIRLFALPFAGGSASSYRGWGEALPSWVEFCPLHLPGRERRLFDPPIDHIEPLVAALAEALKPWIGQPYAFFGHSMGAIVAWELAACLRSHGESGPEMLIVSGHGAPTLSRTFRPISGLADAEFVAALGELGGLPAEILENSELMELVMPALRADFRLCEGYRWQSAAPLSMPVTVFGGRSDPIAGLPELESWQAVTTGLVSLHWFDGDHFFIHSARAVVVDRLSAAMTQHFLQTKGTKSA